MYLPAQNGLPYEKTTLPQLVVFRRGFPCADAGSDRRCAGSSATPRVAKPDLPNPYRLAPDWPTLPASMKGPNGRKWGEVIRVHVAPNGNIWVFHRCFNDQPNGDATCVNRGDANPPILEFDPAGTLLKSFGVGLFAHPHGFTVDKDGNIWATDTNDEETILGMSAKNAQGVTMGQQVLKISPDGKVLMTIGTPGVSGNGPYTFDQPTGVSIAPNGDIFVTDGHSGNMSKSARVVKYSRDGKFIKTVGTPRTGTRELQGSARSLRRRFQGLRVCRRSPEQSHPGVRPGRHFHRRMDAVRPAELGVCRQARQHLRWRDLPGPVSRAPSTVRRRGQMTGPS